MQCKLDFIWHFNINPRTDIYKSRLYLDRNGSDKSGKNFVNRNLNYFQKQSLGCVLRKRRS